MTEKWAVSLALVADKEDTIWLLEQAFSSGSVILGGAAYTCVSRMADPSPSLYDGVRRTLVDIAASDDMPEQKLALNAQIRRLPKPIPLIQTLRLLIMTPRIDYGLATILVLIVAALYWPIGGLEILLVASALIGYKLTLSPHASYRIPGTRLVIRRNPTLPLILIFYARAFAAGFVILVVYLPGRMRGWPIISVGTIAAAFFMVWIPSVGYVCRNRRGVSGFLWPCIPLLALTNLTRKGMTKLRELSISNLLRTLLLIVIEGILLWVAIIYLSPFLTNNSNSLTVALVGGSISAIPLIGISSAYGIYLSRRRRDKHLVRRFFSDEQQFSATNILNVLDQIRTARGVRFFIESALRINLIIYPDMIRILSDIAAAAEVGEAQRKASARKKKREAVVVPGVTPEFADWLSAYAEKKDRKRTRFGMTKLPLLPIAVRDVQGAMLDQIARSIEQVEMARGVTPS